MTSAIASRLPLGTLVEDTVTGRQGEVFDYGLNEDESRVYYVCTAEAEWKVEAVNARVVEP